MRKPNVYLLEKPVACPSHTIILVELNKKTRFVGSTTKSPVKSVAIRSRAKKLSITVGDTVVLGTIIKW